MKYCLFFLLIFSFAARAQQDNFAATYPFKFADIYVDDIVYQLVPYVEQTDPQTGKKTVVPNPRYVPQNEEEKTRRRAKTHYHDFYRVIAGDDIDVPPALDSLPDGFYYQEYPPIPYRDRDTIRFLDGLPACVFYLENNLPEGEAKWSYPDGTVLQTGFYANGLRSGNWFMQDVRFDEWDDRKGLQRIVTKSRTAGYEDGKLHGTQKTIREERPVYQTAVPATEEWITYKHGEQTGVYRYYENGELMTSGTLTDGLITGEWFFYTRCTDPKRKGERILLQHFTLAKNQPATKKPVIRTDYAVATSLIREFSSGYGFPINNSARPLVEFSTLAGNTGALYYIPNGIDPELQKYYWEFSGILPGAPFDDEFELRDRQNNLHVFPRWQLIRDYGHTFHYSGEVVEYYPNGQLRFRFGITDGDLEKEDTVFWRNGQPMNVVNRLPETNGFEQLFFDSLGVLRKHVLYDSLGAVVATPVDPMFLVVDGKRYSRMLDGVEYWNYGNWQAFDPADTEKRLLNEKRSSADTSLTERFFYVPATRSGEIFTYYDNPEIRQEKHFTFSPAYDESVLTDTLIWNNFSFGTTVRKPLTGDEYKLYLQPSAEDTLYRGALPFSGNIEAEEFFMRLYENGRPFTGTVKIVLGTKTNTIKGNARHVTIGIRDDHRSRKLLAQLFPSLKTLFAGDAATKQTITGDDAAEEEEGTIDTRKFLRHYGVKTVTLHVANGLLNGQAVFENGNKKPLAVYTYKNNLQHGTQLSYMNFPRCVYYRRLRSGALDHVEPELRHYLSLREEYSDNTLNGTRIVYGRNGDTTNLDHYVNGVRNGEQLQITPALLHRQQYAGGKIVSEKSFSIIDGTLREDVDYANGNVRIFYANGRLAQSAQLVNGSFADTLFLYADNGMLQRKVLYTRAFPDFEWIYADGQLRHTIDYDPDDSLVYKTERVSFSRAVTEFTEGWIDYRKTTYAGSENGFLESFDADGNVFQRGQLKDGKKTGRWDYRFPTGNGDYSIDYSVFTVPLENGEVLNCLGKYTQCDAAGKPVEERAVIELSTEYSCLNEDYVEKRLYYYVGDTSRSPRYVKNRYENGVVQNEGTVVNGFPDGAWKFYHSDGKLMAAGSYVRGKRSGRWLIGDLSKVNFTGDLCVDPEMSEYDALLKDLDITLAIYEKGEVVLSKYFNVQAE